MAQLHFTYGAMGSGKSLNLMNMSEELTRHELPHTVIKPIVDTRAGKFVTSRLLVDRPLNPNILLERDQDAYKAVIDDMARRSIDRVVRVLVDEAQFLSEEQVDQLLNVALEEDIDVRAFGLLTDFQTKFFPGSQRLMELSHQTTELETTCRCGGFGRNNTRKVNGAFVFSGGQVAIDGEGEVTYESLCRECYTYEKQLALV